MGVTGTADGGEAPRVDASAANLTLRTHDTGIGFFGFGRRSTWNLLLPQDPALDLDGHDERRDRVI